MKQTTLGMPHNDYRERINRKRVLFFSVLALMVLCHILLCLWKTPENRGWLLWANILTDVLGGWFLLYYQGCVIKPMAALLSSCGQVRESLRGKIQHVEARTQRVGGIDCYAVTVDCRESRVVFLSADSGIVLQCGQMVLLGISANYIVEVEWL